MTPDQYANLHSLLKTLKEDNATINKSIHKLRDEVADLKEFFDARTSDNATAMDEYDLINSTPATVETMTNAGVITPKLIQLPTVRVLLVVGHNAIVKGAYSKHLQQHEYDFNLQLARSLEGSTIYDNAETNERMTLETHIAYRTKNTTRREFARDVLKPMCNRLHIDFIIELHFNAFHDEHVSGMELLYNMYSQGLYDIFMSGLTQRLPLRNRGVKQLNSQQRGYTNVTMLHAYHNIKTPYCILEPFFGSNKSDCNMATKYLKPAMQHALQKLTEAIVKEKLFAASVNSNGPTS